jgi:hypothetical protein
MRLLAVFGTLFVASLALSIYWSATQPLWSFYLMPSRFWQFTLGGAVFIWLHRQAPGNDAATDSHDHSRRATIAGISGLILIFGSARFLHSNITYPDYWALFPSFGTALVLGAIQVSANRGITNLLAHPWLVWIGDRSYSWYLWHWPVLMLAFTLGVKGQLETALLAALSLLPAMFSYRYIELPFWKGRYSGFKPLPIILASILAMLAVIASTYNLFLNIPAPTAVSATQAARLDQPEIYRAQCDDFHSSAEVRPCVFGNQNAPKTAVLLGDSIGVQWFSLIQTMFPPPQWRVVVLTKSACPIVDEDYFYSSIGGVYKTCAIWRNAVLDFLPSLKPDIVFMGSSAGYEFTELQWTEGTTRVLSRITTASKQTIVISGTPALGYDGPSCLERHAVAPLSTADPDEKTCSEKLINPKSANVSRFLGEAVQRFPGTILLDLNDLVCPGGRCSARNAEGIIVFRDGDHLTDTFVRTLIPEAASRLQRSGLEHLLAE